MAIVAALGGGISATAAVRLAYKPALHFADAGDGALVTRGRLIYAQQCASCHGRYLQGQSLWRLADENTHHRAPAHDQSGHTWRHSDEELFHMVKFGRFTETPTDVVSWMPAYSSRLSDDDVLAVIAFIKARWPTGIRVLQAMLNPGSRGMPAEARTTDWRFPVLCSEREALVAGSPK